MRGEPNTKVTLTIYRKDENRTFPVTITREEIKQQSVRGKVVEPGYAWIRVSQFQERTVDDFAKKLEEIYKQEPKLKGLVLDLRNDPGGLLTAAVAISSAFSAGRCGGGYHQRPDARKQANFQRRMPRDYMGRSGADVLKSLPAGLKKVPLIVLVNEGSASASEIVAGALQDHKRAHVDGQPDLWQRLRANLPCAGARYRPEDHHVALLHPEWPVPSRPRVSCRTS